MAPHPFFIGLVDDDPRVLESFEELLASSGYKVSAFPSAEAFLLEGGVLRVDCLISDIGMPGMSGWELLARTHEQRPDLPVVLITARDEEYPLEKIKAKGASYLFRKPVDGRELLSALDGILQPRA